MGVNSSNFSTHPEDSGENISALEQLLEEHNGNSDAHSEQFDNLLNEIKETGAFYNNAKNEVLDASKDAKESAQKAKTSEEGAERSAKACDDAAARVAQMVSDVEADKQNVLLLKASAENFAKVSEERAKEAADSERLAKEYVGNAEAAAEVAKSVHPKVIDGEWWVYDSEKGVLVSSGIKAEGRDGYTPQKGVDYFDGTQGIQGEKGDKGETGPQGYSPVRGVDYYTEEEKTEFLNEVLQEPSTRYANALKGTVSGSCISINDISPVEHTVGCKVSGDGIVPENVKVQVFGKNLIPYPFPSFNITNKEISATDLGDGGILINGTSTKTAFIILSNYSLGKSWITGVGSKFSANSYNENIRVSYDPSDKTTYVSVSAGTVCDNVIFYPQMEVGSKITEYEKGIPYKSFTPNADGTVDGITSVSPYMNILCDTAGVILDVIYNKDSNVAINEKINAKPGLKVLDGSGGIGGEIFNNYDKNIASGEFSTASGHQSTILNSVLISEQEITYISYADNILTLSTTDNFFDTADLWGFRINNINLSMQSDTTYNQSDVVKILKSTKNSNDNTWSFEIETPITTLNLSVPKSISIRAILNDSNGCTGAYSYAEGWGNLIVGEAVHAEGIHNIAEGETLHVEGAVNKVNGKFSHAEGANTTIEGDYAHTEGFATKTLDSFSHAEGFMTKASGSKSHAEGRSTHSEGETSHAEGYNSKSSGIASHAEGKGSTASKDYSHAEGQNTSALGIASHSEGMNTLSEGDYSHAEGNETEAKGNRSHAEGFNTTASGVDSHSEGTGTESKGSDSHSEGNGTTASGQASHSEGMNTTASGISSHSEGQGTNASGSSSHAEGSGTNASQQASHSEGHSTNALGIASHAEGRSTTALGIASHSEGQGTNASKDYSHAEGHSTTASGIASHAEGVSTEASGDYSHAEGNATKAEGTHSHAEGQSSISEGDYSHAEGLGTVATSDASHVQGRFNEFDTEKKYAHIIGWGNDNANRANIHTLDKKGNAFFAGNIIFNYNGKTYNLGQVLESLAN